MTARDQVVVLGTGVSGPATAVVPAEAWARERGRTVLSTPGRPGEPDPFARVASARRGGLFGCSATGSPFGRVSRVRDC